MSAQMEHAYRVMIGSGLGQIAFNCLADNDDDAQAKAQSQHPGKEVSQVLRLNRPPVKKARFTAYRNYPADPFRTSHFVYGLTSAEVHDESRFPLGPQRDENGELYVWSSGINNGEKII